MLFNINENTKIRKCELKTHERKKFEQFLILNPVRLFEVIKAFLQKQNLIKAFVDLFFEYF